ncbi:hypothetical protein Tsubulata_013111 [Turnera subulata]|uniref:Receptor-like serine/threonine-protein kinase n=1 Tax=Turnera subulata TaxID=218843 RepID=A0A9Q0FCJ8_9ROSI|nr:hypothetical protein Tsubulata_013111 [Turnera subulata]
MKQLSSLSSSMEVLDTMFLCFTVMFLIFRISLATDSLFVNQTLTGNGETLVSGNGRFALGFFSPSGSRNRYLGIWYKDIPQQTVVWVANKDAPLGGLSGLVTLTADGSLVIFNNASKGAVWSSNSSTTSTNSPVLQLLNSGNLVVRDFSSDDNPTSYVWQSFDYPGDTLIPGMKQGWNLKTGQGWFLTSWKSLEDPSDGDYTSQIDGRGLPQGLVRQRSEIIFRTGPWAGLRIGGGPEMKNFSLFNPRYVYDSVHMYYIFENEYEEFILSRFVLNQSGILEHLTWTEKSMEWHVSFGLPSDTCDQYSHCGPNGICNNNKYPVCQCPSGFKPKVPDSWAAMYWSDGCVPVTPLNCSAGEGFRKFSRLKLPDNAHVVESNVTASKVKCQEACLQNCSCSAYALIEICCCAMWFGDLLDVRQYGEGGYDLYIRMAASELGHRQEKLYQDSTSSLAEKQIDLPLFDLPTIAAATNNFSFSNKIGEGGFGPVYKGKLASGQEIAVKALSKDSGQGLQEFKNEVKFISKLQHRNLVRLLGCCIHEKERMLIYEYMPNGSLDFYIFNQKNCTILDWKKHFDIIVGIARGLLYLHRDSRLRIIHRDLKASNILLDSDMNPKISDFGLARMLRSNQTEVKTRRVMGTYGYMSPEYAIDGQFSVKSDVFSFGVLLLEIVSGKKNREFYHPDHELNLLGHAWKLWNEGRIIELLNDPFTDVTINIPEVFRCIQIGLLCVQQSPEDRPTMSSVVQMLDSVNSVLPQPKQPGFYADRCLLYGEGTRHTGNEVSISTLVGR